jgi:hypothetical protein
MKILVKIIFCLLVLQSVAQQNTYINSIISEVNIDTLLFRNEEITGERGVTVNNTVDTIFSRHKNKPGNELAYRYIIEKLSSYGLQTDSLLFGISGKNALAIQPGLVYPHKYFIICAHYDGMPNQNIAPAADDNASSVATVLEAARILSAYAFEYTIIYAFWDEEEQGLVGANNYATMAQNQGDSIMGVINMDAIAWDGNNDDVARIHVRPIANSIALGDTVLAINQRYNLGLNLLINNPGATYSDHAAFWNKNFSALLLIEDWDNDPNPQYHTVQDKMIHYNVPYYHKMAKLALASLAHLAIPVGIASMHESNKQFDGKIYPNPIDDFIQIIFDSHQPSAHIELLDIKGNRVYSAQFKNIQNLNIPTYEFSKGIYILQINTLNKKYSKKIIKK